MSGFFKFIAKNIVSIALLIGGIVIGGYVIGAVNNVRDFLFPETAIHVIPSHTIVTSIKNIGQLVTVTSEIGTTDVQVEIHQGFLNAGYYSASHIAIGAIEAGIDFEKIDEDNVQFRDDGYTLTLPPSIITSCRIEHIDQNQHSFTLLQADWDMVRQIAQAEAIEQFANEMIEAGILKRAKERAEELIVDFVEDLTGKATRVVFEASERELELPQSCKPIPPSGWLKDEESGVWKRTG